MTGAADVSGAAGFVVTAKAAALHRAGRRTGTPWRGRAVLPAGAQAVLRLLLALVLLLLALLALVLVTLLLMLLEAVLLVLIAMGRAARADLLDSGAQLADAKGSVLVLLAELLLGLQPKPSLRLHELVRAPAAWGCALRGAAC